MTNDGREQSFDKPRRTRALRALDVALLASTCALYVAARVWRLGATCLWFDEIFGVHAAAWHDAAGMLRFVALDLIHPPLFYALLKVWIAATGAGAVSVWWLRLFPVAAAVAAIVPLVLLARELRLSAGAARLAVLLAAASGTLIKYAQELRMYSLLFLLATCSLWLVARLCNSTARARDGDAGRGEESRRGDESRRTDDVRRVAIALFFVNLLLVYTHYFGWLVVALEVLFVALFARSRLKIFALSVAADAACFAPWVGSVWRAAGAGAFEQNLGWAARPRAWEIFEPFLRLHEPFRAQQQSNEPAVVGVNVVLALVVFAPPLFALCWRVFALRRDGTTRGEGRSRAMEDGDGERARTAGDLEGDEVGAAEERRAFLFLAFFAFAPVVAAFALAQVLPQSIWGVRHLIVVAPAYLLLAAHALESLRPRWLAAALKIVLGCWLALAALVAVARRPPAPVWCAWGELALRAARDGAAAGGVEAAGGGETTQVGATKIYSFEDLAAYQVWYALRASGESRLRVAVVRDAPGVAQDHAFFLPRGFDEVSAETAGEAMSEEEFWIVWRGAAGDEEYPPLKALRARGYEIARLYERDADGQKAFVALARKR